MKVDSVEYSIKVKAQNVAAGSKHADSIFGHICRELAGSEKVSPLLNKHFVVKMTKVTVSN